MRVLIAGLLLLTAFAGCASSSDGNTPDLEPVVSGITPVLDRANLPFNLSSDEMSHTLTQGIYDILEPISVDVNVALPPTEGGAALDPTSTPMVHLGVIMPDIPGCNFGDIKVSNGMVQYEFSVEAGSALNQSDCQVPVVADAGPYWGESDVAADSRGSVRLGETMIQNLVPHGYAVAQISVFGSGKSNHCFDMFGLAEQLGVVGAVEWLGEQSWSNGNVGLIGRSYDGSTPWMAAAHAPEALKTIVPISGLSGLGDLVTWNGASETRVALFQNYIYAQFGLDPSSPDFGRQAAHRATCPDWVSSTAWGAEGYLAGGEMAEGDYWEERNFMPEVLDNYEGSVYMIHGLLDDNVDPHAGWLAHQAIIEKGLDNKGLYGQWYHSYPDRFREHGTSGPANSVRFDWAQDLLEWFDYYLKDSTAQPELHVEVQQFDGRWRLDETLAPLSAEILTVPVEGLQVLAPMDTVNFNLGVINETGETLLGGLSALDIQVAGSAASQIYIELYDATDGSDWGLSYGITRLDRAAGGPELPGTPGVYTIPLQYFAGSLPAGHELGLRLDTFGNNYLPSPNQSPMVIGGGGSVLHLSTIPSDQAVFFEVPTRE